jgi:hypothetical protein
MMSVFLRFSVWLAMGRYAVCEGRRGTAGSSSIASVDFNCLGVNSTNIHWSLRRCGTTPCCLRREDRLITNLMSKTVSMSERNLHRPLSRALDDSGKVSDMSTIAQFDEFQCVQAPSPGRQARLP